MRFLSESQIEELYSRIKNPRMYLITHLLLNTGLHLKEILSLRVGNVSFKESLMQVNGRLVPLNGDLMTLFADFFNSSKFLGDVRDKESFIFSVKYKDNVKPISRIAVWLFYDKLQKELNFKFCNPCSLRNSFAVQLVNRKDVSIATAQKILGHKSIAATSAYSVEHNDSIKDAFDSLNKSGDFLTRIRNMFKTKKNVRFIPFSQEWQHEKILIGRENELSKINELIEKNRNIIIKGKQGVGKSCLLNSIVTNKTILKIDDLYSVKTALRSLLEYILANKEDVAKIIYGNNEAAKKQISRYTVKNLTDTIIKLTKRYQYVLLIDNLTRIHYQGVETLEFLRSHFVIVAACRSLDIKRASFATNFEIIELKNLSRKYAIELVDFLSSKFKSDLEDYYQYQNHIIEETGGNPQFIFEMIDKVKCERSFSIEAIRNLKHNAGKGYIDMTFFIAILFFVLIIFRYYGRVIGDNSYQLIGGGFLIFSLIARQVYSNFRRKYL